MDESKKAIFSKGFMHVFYCCAMPSILEIILIIQGNVLSFIDVTHKYLNLNTCKCLNISHVCAMSLFLNHKHMLCIFSCFLLKRTLIFFRLKEKAVFLFLALCPVKERKLF